MSRRLLAASLLLLAACTGQVPDHPKEGFSPADLRVGPGPLAKAPLRLPGGTVLRVEVARTPADRERGLMFRETLAADSGMLFLFPQSGPMTFWMKNTLVDLDMLFIGGDKRIVVIHRDVPRSHLGAPEDTLPRRSGTGRFVLELPAGASRRYGLKEGDLLDFSVD